MDNSVIAKLGIARLTEIFGLTGIAKPMLNWDDTRMAWDGTIEIYNNEPFSKKTFVGAIPTQVKSHIVDAFHNDVLVDISDLKIYKTEQRVLYLVYEMLRGNETEYKVYYLSLFLWDLEKTISENTDKKQVTLHFLEFPKDDRKAKINILKAFLTESSKQRNLIPGVLSIEDLNHIPHNGELKVDVYNLPASCTIKDFIRAFEQQQPYLYLHDKNFGTNYAIDKFSKGKLFIEEVRPIEIRIDDQILYNEVRLIHSSDENIIYKFGESITVKFTPDGIMYEYSIAGSLKERIIATTLIDGLYDGKPIYINGNERHISLNFTDEQRKTIKNDLKVYSIIRDFFNKIGVNKDLECDNLSAIEWRVLIDFARSELFGIETTAQFHGNTVGFLKAANISIFGVSLKSQNGLYRLYNFFDNNKPVVWYYNNKVKPSSQYLILGYFNDLDIACVDNLDYDKMCSELIQTPLKDDEIWILTNLILRLLCYFDNSKKQYVIEAALRLSKYVYDKYGNEINYLNYIQSVKRLRVLNKNEIDNLIQMRNKTDSLQIKCGCCILLEEVIEYNLYFAQLTKEEQFAFSKYPIAKLI